MNRKLICFFMVFLAFLLSCQSPPKSNSRDLSAELIRLETNVELMKQDTTLFYLDSIQIQNFLKQFILHQSEREKLVAFYLKRNAAYAWINGSGINEYARNFINLLNHEHITKSSDSVFYRNQLYGIFNMLSEEDYFFNRNDSLIPQLEILLTINFFEYAKRNWSGISDKDLEYVKWFIERKKLNYDELLDTVLKKKSVDIASFEPVYRQYGKLKVILQKYDDIENQGGWVAIPDSIVKLKIGDTLFVIRNLKRQLYLLGDLASDDSTNLFDDALESAVVNFQKRHGIKADGVTSGETLLAIRVPVHERIEQILINMERCKWVPVEQKGDYLAVNIPDFKLLVYHNDTLQWSCNVIVGKTKITNNTAIFNDNLEYIVFSPYWNIPKSILIKETLPAVKRNRNYLASHNMEIIDASGKLIAPSSINWNKYRNNFPYTIRQRPGKSNSLGLVKFLFPNSYDIYMHDTPEKSLFGETTRAFSHGCIRIEEPAKLAKYLLREDSAWTDEKIHAYMHGGKQTFVKLNKKVPVFIAYFTAWVDRNGKLNFRKDIYNHDKRMKQLLFSDEK